MNYKITNWNASPSKLKITVVSSLLNMSKTYVRAFHGTNLYGQDMRWSWWHINIDGDPTSELEKDGRLLLDSLVVEHEDLSSLAHKYHIEV